MIATEEQRRCPQCYRFFPWPSSFMGARGVPVLRCVTCTKKYLGWERKTDAEKTAAQTKRARTGDGFTVTFVSRSLNRKLGGIPVSITDQRSCPPSCPLQGQGCYAEFHVLGYHWRRTATRGISWRAFCLKVAALPPGQLWRHNEAGDLPGVGDDLNVPALKALVHANRGRRGFTFTHLPLRSLPHRRAVKHANASGFTINLSADSLADADAKADRNLGPVAVVLPSDAPTRGIRTPAGRHVVVCPAEVSGLTCSECRLCAHATRKSIVGFRAHGQSKAMVSELVRDRR